MPLLDEVLHDSADEGAVAGHLHRRPRFRCRCGRSRSMVPSAARTSLAICVRSHTARSIGILPSSSRLTSSRSLVIRLSASGRPDRRVQVLPAVFVERGGRPLQEPEVDQHRLQRRPHVVDDHVHEIVAQLFERTKTRVALGQRHLRPPERDVRLHPRQDLLELERLGDVVDAAHFERPDLVGRVGQRREEDHRHVLRAILRPEAPADLVAVHLRHGDVQQDEIGRVVLHGLKRLPSVGHRRARRTRARPACLDRSRRFSIVSSTTSTLAAGGFLIHRDVPRIARSSSRVLVAGPTRARRTGSSRARARISAEAASEYCPA